MAIVTSEDIKKLRERSGAGMSDCKKALEATGGDIEAALDQMRKAGQANAAKKEGRIAAEGLILVKIAASQQYAVMIEVNCETDFVSRGVDFKSFVSTILDQALTAKVSDRDALLAMPYAVGAAQSIEEARRELVAKLGENIQVRRLACMETAGVLGTYLHGDRIGVLIDLPKGTAELAKGLAMHIAASKPLVVNGKELGEEVLAREKAIYVAQAQATNKPAEIIEKIVAGQINKFMSEVSLLGQKFVKDPDTLVANILKKENAEVASFVRFELGEGIEKKVTNFAEEVMAAVRG
jgi:elongation factor Ts